jgi:hypothetical protein
MGITASSAHLDMIGSAQQDLGSTMVTPSLLILDTG